MEKAQNGNISLAHTLCNVGLFLDQDINKLKQQQQQFKHQIYTKFIPGNLY